MEKFSELFGNLNVRMHRKQKKAFRDFVSNHAKGMNYNCKVEKSIFANNVVVGDLKKAKYVFCAHYDTPPRLPKILVKHMILGSILGAGFLMGLSFLLPVLAFVLTNSTMIMDTVYIASMIALGGGLGYSLLHLMGLAGNANKTNFNDNTSGCLTLLKLMDKYQSLSQDQKDQIAFVFFDNEEKFLLGSFSYKFKHLKDYKNKTYINMDCVGMGNQMNLYYFGQETQIANQLKQEFSQNKLFTPKLQKSTIMSMSDHFPFKNANHVCLLSVDTNNPKSIFDQIHSSNDNKIDISNIDNIIKTVDNLPFFKDLKNSIQISNFEIDQKLNNVIINQVYSSVKTNQDEYCL